MIQKRDRATLSKQPYERRYLANECKDFLKGMQKQRKTKNNK